MIRTYWAPAAIISGSGVKTLMTARGKQNITREIRVMEIKANRRMTAKISRIWAKSFLPQYWETSTADPPAMPLMKKVSNAVAWLARETAASDTSPREPTMTLSSMLTLREIKD